MRFLLRPHPCPWLSYESSGDGLPGRFFGHNIFPAQARTFSFLMLDLKATPISELPLGLLWHLDRANIERDLGRSGGEHIILVRYAEKHNPHHEWVYNAAEIDAADVIWARSLGTERDQRLRDYFHDRSIWHLDADVQPPRLLPAS